MMKKLLENIFYWTTVGVFASAGLVVIFSAFGLSPSVRFLTVQSASMEPNIPVGSLIIVRGEHNYRVGDVITFHPEKSAESTITHRISAVVYPQPDKPAYLTKGDANEDIDSEKVSFGQIIGKAVLTIPFLGYLVAAIKTPIGAVFFIIIPAAILAFSQFLSIKNEITKMISTKKTKQKRIIRKKAFA